MSKKHLKEIAGYRPDVDGLRAVAILVVVFFHAYPTVLTGGFIGVDVFFVISGFLISGILFKNLQAGNFSIQNFYANRVRRIFPALIIMLSFCYAFGWFTLLTNEYEQLGKHIAGGVSFIQNVILWKEAGYFDTASELKPLMHLWSLAVEEQFYVIYPAFIWCVWRFRFDLLKSLSLLAIISLLLNVTEVEKDTIKTFFLPQTRFWELMLGGILAYIQLGRSNINEKSIKQQISNICFYLFQRPHEKKLSEIQISNYLGILGLTLIIISAVTLDQSQLFPGYWALMPVLGATLLIFSGPLSWVNAKILSHPLMVFIGLISYPLYLWHWPLLAFARIFEFGTPVPTVRFALVIVSFLFAWLTYYLIEKPIRFGKKAWWKTAALCVLMLLLGFIGYNTYQRNGYEFRYQNLVLNESELATPDPSIEDSECNNIYPEFSSAGYCKRSKNKPPNVLILGDSHAGHLYHGLATQSINTSHSISSIVRGGCLPFSNLASNQRGEPENCLSLMTSALKFAAETESIETVILAARGPLYIFGKGFGHALSESKVDRVLHLTSHSNVSSHSEIFRIAMESTIKNLLSKNKNIIFVLDVPELDFDAKSCNESPLPLRKEARQICAISRQSFDDRNREYRSIVYSVLKKFPSVQIFDAAEKLCDEKLCWAKKNNELLYADTNHLSLRGSEYISKSLIELISLSKK